MNYYHYQFVCNCPNNSEAIVYTLDIQSEEMIMVEDIKTATKRHLSAFHETLADSLYRALGGRQVLSAHHHGVDVVSERGTEENERLKHYRDEAKNMAKSMKYAWEMLDVANERLKQNGLPEVHCPRDSAATEKSEQHWSDKPGRNWSEVLE